LAFAGCESISFLGLLGKELRSDSMLSRRVVLSKGACATEETLSSVFSRKSGLFSAVVFITEAA
jgi:hypothetical protein